MALYCIPTAVVAFLFAAIRFHLFDRRIEQEIATYNETKKD